MCEVFNVNFGSNSYSHVQGYIHKLLNKMIQRNEWNLKIIKNSSDLKFSIDWYLALLFRKIPVHIY